VLLTTEKALVDDELEPRVSGEHSRNTRACPRCDSHSIAHSRIRGFVGQMARRVLRVRPYRCLDCWHRFLGVTRQG
jgi:anti-sigma factor RsiW